MTEMFGERLKRLRTAQHFSTRWLAERAGCTHASIVRLENCEHKPRYNSIHALARALHVSTDYLLTGRENSHIAALHHAIRAGATNAALLTLIGETRT